MLELYNFSQSTCSQKVRICLAEKKLDWVDRRLVSKDRHHISPEYLKLNPNGVVPTLVHDGAPVIESSVIVQYLDDVFPDPRLTPGDPKTVAQMRAWVIFVEQVPTPAVRYPSFQHGGLMQKFQAMSRKEFEATIVRRPLKSRFYRRMGQMGFPQEDIDDALDDIRKTVCRMEIMLRGSNPWLLGEQYTIADICVAPLIDRMQDMGYSGLWEADLPHVTGWLRRMKARPAYTTTFYWGSRLSEQYPDIAHAHGEEIVRALQRSSGSPSVSTTISSAI
ncbi:MAG: glutathione S-transferase family protein [Proteobacteria bacterium]|nr:glutathione S-transferase family protein [Pseudomonadota bacterium]